MHINFPARVCLAALLLLLITPLIGGAWVQKARRSYVKITTSYFQTSEEYDFTGEKKPLFQDLEIYVDPLYQEFQVAIYGEYGLFPDLTVVGKIPFKVTTDTRTIEGIGYLEGEQRHSTTGFGDLELKVRYALLRAPLTLSFQPGVKFPLGYNTSTTNEGPSLGTGTTDLEAQLLIGRSLHPLPVYFSGGVGYRWRSDALHDEIFFAAELGAALGQWFFKTELFGVRNTTTPPDIYGQTIILPLPGGGGTVPFRPYGDQHFLKLQAETVYTVKEGVGVSGEIGHVLSGKNIVAGASFAVGLVLKR